MWNGSFAFLTTSPGKGWATSLLLHVLALGTLTLMTSGRTSRHLVEFASSDSHQVAMLLTVDQSHIAHSAATIHVEIQPLEAKIQERRFSHTPSHEMPPDPVEIDQVLELLTSTPRRLSRSTDLPKMAIPSRRMFSRQLQRAVKRASPRVPTMPSAQTTLPKFGDNRPPNYPQNAVSRGWQGTVLLRVGLSSSGEVTFVDVIDSSGYPILDGAAVTAVKTWTASPATRDGQPVATTVRLPVTFRLPAALETKSTSHDFFN